MPKLLQVDVARHLKADPAQVVRWVKRGMPTDDLEAAEAWHRTHVRTRQSRKPVLGPSEPVAEPVGGDPATRSWRDRLDRANARVRELELEREQGKYLPVGQLTEILASMSRQVVSVLDGVPGALRRRAPGVTPDVLKVLDTEITKARNVAAAIVPEAGLE